MKAAVIRQFNSPLTLEEVNEPVVEPGWVLVKVKACGLCGTDLKIVSGAMPGLKLPLIPGHEIAGEVLRVGQQVSNVNPGDRVAVYFYVTCGRCSSCRQGWETLCTGLSGRLGFDLSGGCAEIVKVPAGNVLPIPQHMPFEAAAILADAVATGYHALVTRSNAKAGQTVAIVGMGGLGLHAVQIAKVLGLRTVAIDVYQAHLDMAANLGADIMINAAKEKPAEAVPGLTGRSSVDIVLEMSGNPDAAVQAISLLGPRGRLIIVGHNPLQPMKIISTTLVSRELEIVGSRASTRQDLAEAIKLVAQGKVKPIIQEVMPLSDINRAYENLKSGRVIGRIVVQPQVQASHLS